MSNKKIDRYKLRELERLVEKERVNLREKAEQCPDFEPREFYKLVLSFNPQVGDTEADKDWNFIRACAARLELSKLKGAKDFGARDLLPAHLIPLDAFPFGDKSL